ncbi:CotS family spore coat protein [Marinicrinis lubricantis]|uniref:CotS family spore coat protein n=1 Tax=Marinicrinis lubricantis TaxID=2086470 RepID=A0ABW1IKZ7_9BACL
MEGYQIVPWDHLIAAMPADTVLEQYVPPEVEAVAQQVIQQYDMQVHDMTLITSKPDKGGAIWKINTDKGPRSLKVLHRTPQRSLFSVGAQEYLVQKGARVPALIRNKQGDNCTEAGGKLWIVTNWIELAPASKIDLEGASALCYGLGEFHKLSKGYIPPFGAAVSSRLYRWPKYYEKIVQKIGWFRDIARAYGELEGSQLLLSVVDDFELQAKQYLERFHQSAYKRMAAKGDAYWGLVHQDYGWSNGQMGPGGIWIIDLDGVAYDFPIRDLRKLITSTMDDMGNWDLTWIRGMIDAYHQANPLDQETFDLLWIDMAFPNEFYKHVKEVLFHPAEFIPLELQSIIQRVLTTEASKWQALAELEKDLTQYPAGDYPEEEATIVPVLVDESIFAPAPLSVQPEAQPVITEPAAAVEPVAIEPTAIEPVAAEPALFTEPPVYVESAAEALPVIEPAPIPAIPVYSETTVSEPAPVMEIPISVPPLVAPAPALSRITKKIKVRRPSSSKTRKASSSKKKIKSKKKQLSKSSTAKTSKTGGKLKQVKKKTITKQKKKNHSMKKAAAKKANLLNSSKQRKVALYDPNRKKIKQMTVNRASASNQTLSSSLKKKIAKKLKSA